MLENLLSPIDDALGELRVTGSVLLFESYEAPWAVRIEEEACLRGALGLADDTRVIPFHFVRSGQFNLDHGGATPMVVQAGEVAICPDGRPHRMSSGTGVEDVSILEVLRDRGEVRKAGGEPASGEATELLCGVFVLRNTDLNPLFLSLPPVVRISAGADSAPRLNLVASMLEQEVAAKRSAGFTACRLIEIFFAEAVQQIAVHDARMRPGWYRGLADPKLSIALKAFYADPARAWTVGLLSGMTAMSPSRFAARFRETVGQSVMSY
ncbi:MAG TPA: cupin domain-containing protein, partial [Rhabdaerophilum sp.]|nr:cupin domain-containing protein [Rhabdaerophilum sp.]